MALFVVDKAGDQELLKNDAPGVSTKVKRGASRAVPLQEKKRKSSISQLHVVSLEEEAEEDDGDYFGLPPPSVDLSEIIERALAVTQPSKSKSEEEMDRVSELLDAINVRAKERLQAKNLHPSELDYSDFNVLTGKLDDEKLTATSVEKVMQKSVLVPGLSQQNEMPIVTEKKRKQLGKMERAKTKGPGWFNLPATEQTEEVRNDLKILQMRSVLDPKRFYKKNDLKVLPKYFQIGTVQHSPLDYYSERNTRHSKKRTMVDELLADEQFQAYNKRKYKEVVARKDMYARRKAQQKMKKLKKKK